MIRFLLPEEMAAMADDPGQQDGLIEHYGTHTAIVEAYMAQIERWDSGAENVPPADAIAPTRERVMALLNRSTTQVTIAYRNLVRIGWDPEPNRAAETI